MRIKNSFLGGHTSRTGTDKSYLQILKSEWEKGSVIVKTLSSGIKQLELDFLCGLGQATFLLSVSASLSIRVTVIVKMEWRNVWMCNKCSLNLSKDQYIQLYRHQSAGQGGEWRSKFCPSPITKPRGSLHTMPGTWKLSIVDSLAQNALLNMALVSSYQNMYR